MGLVEPEPAARRRVRCNPGGRWPLEVGQGCRHSVTGGAQPGDQVAHLPLGKAQRVLVHPEVAAALAVEPLACAVLPLGEQGVAPGQQRPLLEPEGVGGAQLRGWECELRQVELSLHAVGVGAVGDRVIATQFSQQFAEERALLLVGGHGDQRQGR